MKKIQPDPIAQEAFEKKEKQRVLEDKLYEEERIRNINAMTPEEREEKIRVRNINMRKALGI